MEIGCAALLANTFVTWFLALGMLSPLQAEEVRGLAIQYDRRVVTFAEFARQMIEEISGQPRLDRREPWEVVLSMLAEPDEWQDVPCIAVRSERVRSRLGLRPEERLVSRGRLARDPQLSELLTEPEPDRELRGLAHRCALLDSLLEQEVRLVPPPDGGDQWRPILRPDGYPPDQQVAVKRLWASVLAAVRDDRPERYEWTVRQLATVLTNLREQPIDARLGALAQVKRL